MTDAAPIVNAGAPTQIVAGEPAAATGRALTVKVNELDFTHPAEFVSVSV